MTSSEYSPSGEWNEKLSNQSEMAVRLKTFLFCWPVSVSGIRSSAAKKGRKGKEREKKEGTHAKTGIRSRFPKAKQKGYTNWWVCALGTMDAVITILCTPEIALVLIDCYWRSCAQKRAWEGKRRRPTACMPLEFRILIIRKPIKNRKRSTSSASLLIRITRANSSWIDSSAAWLILLMSC